MKFQVSELETTALTPTKSPIIKVTIRLKLYKTPIRKTFSLGLETSLDFPTRTVNVSIGMYGNSELFRSSRTRIKYLLSLNARQKTNKTFSEQKNIPALAQDILKIILLGKPAHTSGSHKL